jgi:hypothetical protein
VNGTLTVDSEHGIAALEWLKKLYDLQGGWNIVAERRAAAPTRPPRPARAFTRRSQAFPDRFGQV